MSDQRTNKVAAGIHISGRISLKCIQLNVGSMEDQKNFRPNPGKITNLHFPGGHGV